MTSGQQILIASRYVGWPTMLVLAICQVSCGKSQLAKTIDKHCQDRRNCKVRADQLFGTNWDLLYMTYGPSLSEDLEKATSGAIKQRGIQEGQVRIVKFREDVVIEDHVFDNNPRVYFNSDKKNKVGTFHEISDPNRMYDVVTNGQGDKIEYRLSLTN